MCVNRSQMPAISQIQIDHGFMGAYRRIVRDSVLPYQWQALSDLIPDAEPSHAIENMRLAGEKNRTGQASGRFRGAIFQDTDLYKWLEAVAYQLAAEPDPQLQALADAAIGLVAEAQEPDGYLDTYYTLNDPEHKWSNLRDNHELYCSGHMIEAAVAWFETAGRQDFLQVACKNADLLCRLFGDKPNQLRGYPGHPEAEMALMRLYQATGRKDYLDLATFFIRERGQEPLYFIEEANRRGNPEYWASEFSIPALKYCQADQPIARQRSLDGHAVRALYLLSGLIDVARAAGDETMLAAAGRLWDNLAATRLYVTGGVGSTHHGEAFTFDYDLPNDTVYAETCASIALIFAARRMLQLDLDSRYADVMERALYNTCLGSMQLDGTRFLYVNPLMVWPAASLQDYDHRHVTPERQKWFGCACCPPNLARLLTSVGQYAYGQDGSTLHMHLYLESEASFSVNGQAVQLSCRTRYPLDGQVSLHKSGAACQLALRIPDWCSQFSLSVDGRQQAANVQNGYVLVSCPAGDTSLELSLAMQPRRVYCHEAVPENAGKVCLQRGPLVYCLEEADNGPELWNCVLPAGSPVSEIEDLSLFGGCVRLTAPGYRRSGSESALYRYDRPAAMQDTILNFIPYYAWSNRQPGEMLVWLLSGN